MCGGWCSLTGVAGSQSLHAASRQPLQPARIGVRVEANLFGRIARVFRSYGNALGKNYSWPHNVVLVTEFPSSALLEVSAPASLCASAALCIDSNGC